MRFRDYVDYMLRQADEEPLYIFDEDFGDAAPGMLQWYAAPRVMDQDFAALLGALRGARWSCWRTRGKGYGSVQLFTQSVPPMWRGRGRQGEGGREGWNRQYKRNLPMALLPSSGLSNTSVTMSM